MSLSNITKVRYNTAKNNLSKSEHDGEIFLSVPDILYRKKSGVAKEDVTSKLLDTHLPEKKENEEKHAMAILCAVVLFNIIYGYHNACFGLYYVVFTDHFETTKATAGLIGSILVTTQFVGGLFASVFQEIYGTKRVAVFGSFIAVIGLFSSAFSQSIYMLYVTYGFITGFGISFGFLISSVIIQQYFDKHRSMATTLSLIGIPIGSLMSPFITNFLLSTFGWRGTIAIHSSIFANNIAISMLYAPKKIMSAATKPIATSTKNICCTVAHKLLDISAVKSIRFAIFIISNICTQFVVTVFIQHTPSRAVFFGASMNSAGYLITVLWIASLCSRLICSVIMGFVFIEPITFFSFVLFGQAVVSLALPFCTSYLTVLICTAVFGLFQGLRAPLLLLTTVKLSGPVRYGKARAVCGLVGSLGNFAGTPVTGLLFDLTQNYNIPFYFTGLVGLFGAVCNIVVFILYKTEEHKQKKLSNTQPMVNEELSDENNVDWDIFNATELEMNRARTFTM